MEQVVKIAAAGLCGVVLLLTVKKQNPETVLLLILAVILLMLSAILPVLSDIKTFIERLGDSAKLSPAILSPLVKILGIAIVTKLGSEAARDCEAKAIAAGIEMSGAAAAVYTALPLLSAALRLITSFV